jgi:hypothetical protein
MMAIPFQDLPRADPPRIPFPAMPRTERITRSIGEHEILLKFTDDDHAVLFGEWFNEHGWDMFLAWEAARGQ